MFYSDYIGNSLYKCKFKPNIINMRHIPIK